jgi:hypothetical protein
MKEEFIRRTIAHLDNTEKYMNEINKKNIAEYRWQRFVDEFLTTEICLKYINGEY